MIQKIVTTLAFVAALGAIMFLYPESIERKAVNERNADFAEAFAASGAPWVEISVNRVLTHSLSAPALLGLDEDVDLTQYSPRDVFPNMESPFETAGSYYRLQGHGPSDSLLLVIKGDDERFALVFILNESTLD